MNRPSEKTLLWIIILTALFIRVAFVFETPAWQAPDEYPHYWYAGQIAQTGDLPQSNPRFPHYESYQPPLYYFIASLIIKIFPEDISYNPDPVAPPNLLVGLRFLSVIFGILAILISYFLFKRIPELTSGDRLFATAFVAFLPTFVGVTSSVNNDSLVVFFSVLCLYYLMNKKPGNKTIFLSGLWAGLALLTKMNAIVLVPLIIFCVCRCTDGKISSVTRKIMPALAGWAIGAIILLMRNYTQYESLLALTPGIQKQYGFSITDLFMAIRNLTWSFWLAFGRKYQIAPAPVVYLLSALPLMMVSVWGWIKIYRRHQSLLMISAIAIVTAVAASLVFTLSYPVGTQTSWGKNLYPVLPIIAIFLVMGWKSVSSRYHYIIPVVAIVMMLSGVVWGLCKSGVM